MNRRYENFLDEKQQNIIIRYLVLYVEKMKKNKKKLKKHTQETKIDNE